MKHYFWRAELQANGQIHFHLIVDHYIPKHAVQHDWNKLIFSALGLSDTYTDDTKLIVTTIQKLNTAISKKRHDYRMKSVKCERIVFIFDECHRSQFGDTHKRIESYFEDTQSLVLRVHLFLLIMR